MLVRAIDLAKGLKKKCSFLVGEFESWNSLILHVHNGHGSQVHDLKLPAAAFDASHAWQLSGT